MVPSWPQDEQDGPSWCQDGPKLTQDGSKVAPSCHKLAPKWSQDGPKMAAEIIKNLRKINVFALGLHSGPKQGQDVPRCPQDGPRWPKVGPKLAQDGSKLAPRWPQDGPKMGSKTIKNLRKINVLALGVQSGPKQGKMPRNSENERFRQEWERFWSREKAPRRAQDGPREPRGGRENH